MNCDHAFELLTDLDRRSSQELAEHLDGCRRCRDMAETLSPVLGLWDAVTTDSESTAILDGESAQEFSADANDGAMFPISLSDRHSATWDNAVRSDKRESNIGSDAGTLPAVDDGQSGTSKWDTRSTQSVRWRTLLAAFAAGLLVAAGLAAFTTSPRREATSSVVGSECLWQQRELAGRGAASSERPATVVLSCVTCHLEQTP